MTFLENRKKIPKNMSKHIQFFNQEDIKSHINIQDAIPIIEEAFKSFALGNLLAI